MRLAYVDPQSYRGLAKYDVAYLRGLKASGFPGEICFFCSDLLDQQPPSGIALRRIFHYNRKRSGVTKLLSYLLSMARLLWSGLRGQYAVFHIQWVKFAPVDLMVIVLLRKLAKARVVITAHNVVPHGQEHGRHRILGHLYRAVDRIVVHSEQTADEIAHRFDVDAGRFRVLRHGLIDLESSGAPEYEEQLRDFVTGRDVCFIFFGRGSHYKGLDVLLGAWPRIVEATHANAGLMVMGAIDPELKAAVRDAVEKSHGTLLVVDDRVAEADLYHAVMASSAVILPHREISQSGVLLSVLGLGIPVVVAPLAGLREPLEIAPVGRVFDGTEGGLVAELVSLADNPGVLSAIRSNHEAWQAVRQAYDWKTIAAAGIAVYEELLQAAAGAAVRE